MDIDLYNLIDTFSTYRVLVIGEAMLDSYLEGKSDRLCREAPVPVVVIRSETHVPGGAGNTAVNIRGLGAQPRLLSAIGDDQEGSQLREALEREGVSTQHLIVTPGRQTLAKQRVMAGSQMIVRFDQGSTEPIDERTENILINQLVEFFPRSDAVIISDYGYGVLTPRIIQVLADLQARSPRVVVADSKRLQEYRMVNLTAVKPNYTEAIQLLGLASTSELQHRVDQIQVNGRRILDLTKAQIAAVTIDQDGALIFERDHPVYRTYATPEPDSKAAGAGDTFISALTLALVSNVHTPTAAELASAAASIVVGKQGTAACSADDLKSYFTAENKYASDVFYLAARIASYRRLGKKVVFTNGCFDILHRGHIAYLNQAKSYGDILIIGLNSDASVRRLKGPSRPINPLEDRAQILAALSCVDHIVPFDADTPIELIRAIQPDVYVKGGDYSREKLPEARVVEDMGGRVEILGFVQDHSTTGVIERIRKMYASAD